VDGKDCEGLVLVGIVALWLRQLKLDAAGFKSLRHTVSLLSQHLIFQANIF